jgi:membrane protease YdiL (CAAX protease family)
MVGYSNQDLGITRINNKRSIVDVLPITLLLALLGLGLWLTGFSRIQMNESWLFFLFYIFISSPLQEFLYRGALGAFIQKLTKNYITRMLITSLLYSFVHIIYKDILTLALTFAIGLIWFRIYDKTKNLLGVSISHAVLGVVTIIAGIIN